MYERHPAFEEPGTPDAMVWRYTNLPKFLLALHSNSLHFARGDQFEDPYEGMLTDYIAKNIRSSSEETLRMWHQAHVNNRFDTYLNCWHLREHESAAMWKLYGLRNAGIAIRSTFKSLIESLSEATEPIHVGMVHYGDEQLRGDTMPNAFSFWMTKRKSFEHEHELRAIIWRPRNLVVGTGVQKGGKWSVVGYPVATPDTPLGIDVKVRLENLVHRVILSPDTPDWMIEVIQGVVGKYGYAFPIERSRLYELTSFET